jgi:DNA-binding protein YbaB
MLKPNQKAMLIHIRNACRNMKICLEMYSSEDIQKAVKNSIDDSSNLEDLIINAFNRATRLETECKRLNGEK